MTRDPITNAEIPTILYKYRDSDNSNHLNIIENLELFFPSPKKFNDPFDCKIPINYKRLADDNELLRKFVKKAIESNTQYEFGQNHEEIIENSIKSNLADLEFLTQHEENTVNQLNNDIGVLCMSEENNNILLWSHYAQCHSGFCLGINYDHLIDLDTFGTGGPIHYTNIYPVISPVEDNQLYIQIFYKSLVWAYEKEYRLLKMYGANSTLKIGQEVIEEIYLGLNIEPKQKDKIISICKSNLPNTKIYQMTKDDGRFSLKANPL